MSMQDYEKAKELIKKSTSICTFVGKRNEALIQAAEKHLSLKFPETYHKFLLEFGAGGLGSFEIYGVINEDFENSGIPDVVWLTSKGRKEWGLPPHLIPVYDLGDGELFCLNIKKLNDEANVVAYTPGYSSNVGDLEIIAVDFGSFLLSLVIQEEQGR